MIQIHRLRDGLELYKALGSPVRLGIVKMLAGNRKMTLGELGASLDLSPAALTPHIQKLQSLGVIQVERNGNSGAKICSLAINQFFLDIGGTDKEIAARIVESSLAIGDFSDCRALPPCGAASRDRYLLMDQPSGFTRIRGQDVQLLWFIDGWIEYRIPNQIPEGHFLVQLTLSLELSSSLWGAEPEQQGDIHFTLNGRDLGNWVTFSPSAFSRGIYTPSWWTGRQMQHGFLKMLVLNHTGVFLDGKQIHAFSNNDGLDQIGGSELVFRMTTHSETGHKGGLALYGKDFGSYRQGINVRMHYMPKEANYMGEAEV